MESTPQPSFCIHAHFYQPPREDPQTGVIPPEKGALPFANWNERIFAECYLPNVEHRNFEKISFNVGPTLFQWMDHYDPLIVQRIVAQDRANLERNGVGNAMAQAYNHAILPLATRRDKVTQVRWGIADFEWRFGRKPKGMWLPETAVDLETLGVLAEWGIEFTILAPWQAVVPLKKPCQPARVKLPGGKSIVAFFYNQEISTRVSFDPSSTVNADDFVASLLLPKYRARPAYIQEPQIILIASDGELYGHHQPFREKFLAYLMDGALTGRGLQVTFPELWLKQYPVCQMAEIAENTSWSCHHGVLRWSGECGCTPDGQWKAPLRRALDRLATSLDQAYATAIHPYVDDPWELRDRYIWVMLGAQKLEDLLGELSGEVIAGDDLVKIRLLLAAQLERQRMFTSCGWFFEDFDRIEPRNDVVYAAQAIRLTAQATGVDLSGQALRYLHTVKSRRTGLRGDQVFKQALSTNFTN